MKLIKTEAAVGHVLCHDITQIIRGEKKGAVFKKGHIITEEDIPVLLSVGKDNIYIWENDEAMIHENDAAQMLYDLCKSENTIAGTISEGKIEVISACDGLLKIDLDKLKIINSFGEMMVASRHGNFPVKKGDKIAGTRIIPLVIEKEKMNRVKNMVGDGGIFHVLPFKRMKVGIVTTGNEVFYGRIQDTFTPVIEDKIGKFGAKMICHKYCSDDPQMIVASIKEILEEDVDMVICTGGMSVDPDDMTPFAIRNVCGGVVSYGAPVLPGAMFLLAYYGQKQIPVVGLPGCVMYAKRTIFDLILPRIIAGEMLVKEDIDILGEGGLCLGCDVCTFPNCGFGK